MKLRAEIGGDLGAPILNSIKTLVAVHDRSKNFETSGTVLRPWANSILVQFEDEANSHPPEI